MERGIPKDEANVLWMLGHDLFDGGIESPATLTGWIEKLDDGDRSTRWPDDRRMWPDEMVGLRARDTRLLICVAVLIHICPDRKYCCGYDGDDDH
jgi:hypothetical protein